MRSCQILFFLVLFAAPSLASYRVYKLKIFHYDFRGKKAGTELLLSTMDPLQYEHYHTGYRRDLVQLVDTWHCPGDTNAKAYCPKPKWRDPFVRDPRDKRPYLPYNFQPVIP